MRWSQMLLMLVSFHAKSEATVGVNHHHLLNCPVTRYCLYIDATEQACWVGCSDAIVACSQSCCCMFRVDSCAYTMWHSLYFELSGLKCNLNSQKP
jgi:hypothetical protein